MSTVGGGVTGPHERSLNRKSSKSRLEKQHEVEDEDPPGRRGTSRTSEESRTQEQDRSSIVATASASLNDPTALTTVECRETSLSKVGRVPFVSLHLIGYLKMVHFLLEIDRPPKHEC